MANEISCPFPVGSIYITVSTELPSSTRPGTYRVPFGKGRAIICVNDESTVEWLKKPGQTGGNGAWTTKTITQGDEGSATVISEQSTNYQPSITAYIWRRALSSAEVESYNGFNIDTEEIPEVGVYDENVIIDAQTGKAQQPDPYNPI